MKKRILSFVLALLMMVSTVPAPVFAADGGEAAPVAETEAAPTTETTAPTEPSTEPSTEPVCATCGANGCTSEHLTWCPECKKDDCGVDHVSAAEVDPCATCGNEVCTCGSTEPACTVCGETGCTKEHKTCETCGTVDCTKEHKTCETCGTVDCTKEHKTCETCGTMDCTADHTNWCDTCKKDNCGVDHAAELPRVPMTSTGPKQETSAVADEVHPMVGKIVTLNTKWPTAIPDVNNVSNGNMTSAKAYPEHMEIEAVATVNNVDYYQLKAAPGYTWPDYVTDMNAGTTVNYEHYWIEASKVKLVEENCPVCGKPGCTTEHVQCDKCGEYDCTRLHFWCDRCNQYDCGKSHLICRACGEVDCTENHVFCGYCNSYDSCPGHDFSPVTTPVIPANPEMTPGADVSIVDENGSAITGTNGLVIREGTKTSISAWTDLTGNIDYQWQICYDDENDLWTNIQGQTGKGILVSPAMVNSVIQLTESAMIRCRITSGTTVQYSADIPVEVVQNASASMNRYGLARTARNTALYADAPELNVYTVVINYVYEDNAPVTEPYTATLAAGSSFSATVTFPSVMGYLPYVGNEVESKTSLDLNITNIQANETYTVTYKPTDVNYTVFHYHQNLNDDGYTIAATETKQGLTNSTVPEVAKDYAGFYELLYERPTIAADGSTEVEIYYDREYYLMIFNLGEGGYGVEPIYARYGAPVEIGTPKRPGYTFDGWSPAVPANVPVDGGIYTAQWTVNDKAKVKVVIWGENPNDEGYSYLTTGELMLTPNTQYTYNGTDQLYLYCDQEVHTHGASCIVCGKEEHTQHTDECLGNCIHPEHKLECYQTRSDYTLREATPGQTISTTRDGVYSYRSNRVNHYYLYLDGKWYCYYQNSNGNKSDTQSISLDCDHNHTNSCYSCEVHTHTTGCYGCGKEEHLHDSNCNGTVDGLDKKLWSFVKSDEITVNPNGSSVINVYYDRVEYTFTFKVSRTTVHSFAAKWGSNIRQKWTFKGTNGTNYSPENKDSWEGDVLYTARIYFVEIMPARNITFTRASGNTTSNTFHYYVESLPGETGDRIYQSKSYNWQFDLVNDFKTLYYDEDFFELSGFTKYKSALENGTEYPLSNNGTSPRNDLYFYYTRHKYAIEFYNPTELIKKTEGVPYESPLGSYNWTPDSSYAPSVYEPGSVAFGGWYLSPACTGDEYVLTDHTMPVGTKDGDTTLTLYAKWVPVMRTVEFYLDKTAMENGPKLYADQTTPHGSLLKNTVAVPDNGDYEFVGWFYMDGDEEKAFLFPTMVITKDMKVYGKWSSNVLKEYTVYFKIQGTDTQIADPITGSGVAGHTKTFDAKGGTDLYASYQAGYFPLVKSHSMKLDIENEANNTFTFWYVQKEAVPYTVYYVAETLKEDEIATQYETITRDGKTYFIIAPTKENGDNRKAVVTEKFEPVSGYMPDAYQKRLVVDGTEGAVNEIIFYYSVDSVHAYYKITHYTQNTDGEHWTEYASSEVQGEIGKTYSASPLTIPGFTYDPNAAGTVTTGNLTADGLELKLYYVRNSYPYEVRYLEKGTGIQLAEPKTRTGLYGAVVSESAVDIANYIAVDPTSQTLTIRIEESRTEAKLNIITFYYEQKVTINYVAIGQGSVTPESEALKVLSGVAQGSTATAAENHRFVGWYSDEACTVRISEDAKYVPTKAGNAVWTNATYYAKFEPNAADLTIEKEGWLAIDENQTFIFDVTDSNGFEITVTINGNGSVTIEDLPIGQYTVTERTDWSWRYTPEDDATKEITLQADPTQNVVSFVNNRNIPYWLSGDSFNENQFTVKPKTQE